MFLRKSSLALTFCVLLMGLLCPKSSRAVTVTVFSDFGPGQSFQYDAGFSLYGPSRSAGVPFIPATTVTLLQIDVGVSCCNTINGVTASPTGLIVWLMSDVNGVPGYPNPVDGHPSALLEQWTIPAESIPTAGSGPFAPITLVSTTPVTLVAGTRYWLTIYPGAFISADYWNFSTQSGNYDISLDAGPIWNPVGYSALPAFDVLGTVNFRRKWPYIGLGLGQTAHLVAGPVAVPPGVPVEATLGFVDIDGNDVVPPMKTKLNPGQTAALDFNADILITEFGQRVEVRPVLTPISSAAGISAADVAPEIPAVQGSVEVIDNITKLGTVLVPGEAGFFATPLFLPQSLTAGRTLRVTLSADPPSPCIAEVSFSDAKGNRLGFPTQVNLSPGQSTVVGLNADALKLKFAEKIDVQTSVVLTSPTAFPGSTGPQQAPACPASVEVFDHRTGRTSISQVSGTDE